MRKTEILIVTLVINAISHAATLCSASSPSVPIDLTTGERVVTSIEKITYSPQWIDVEVGTDIIKNGGFENANTHGSNYQYIASDKGSCENWEGVENTVGFTKDSSPWTANNDLPNGNYAAFIQQYGSLFQTVNAPVSGSYELSFVLASRNEVSKGHEVDVFVDDEMVMRTNVSSTKSVIFKHDVELTRGSHKITFKGVVDPAYDRSTILDDVSLKFTCALDYKAVVAVNGTTLKSATGAGSVAWKPTRNGTYTLTHKVMNGTSQVGSTLSATFSVAGIYPANPTISPATETKFVGSQEVTLSCGTTDATIYYTIDGSEPTMESLVYSGPFTITETTTVNARAFFENGDACPEKVTATYILNQVKAPEIAPISGTTFETSQTVTISCATEGATIYYTLDGSEPMAESSAYKRFRISGKTTVKAIAVADGMADSEIVTAEYALGQCPKPVISTTSGETFYHKGNQVSIAYDCEEGIVHYTTDGSEPTKESPVYEGPFTTDESMVVKAKAFSDNYFDSAVVTATLTREWETVATPVITAAESFTGAKTKVEIACATEGATIRYTLNGSDPNSHAKKYTGPFYVTEGCTIKAYAVLDDYTNSEIAAKTITKVWGIGDSVALPDQTFTTSGDVEWVDSSGEAMKSGAITDNQKSILSTSVVGKGVLSFKWKVSCEEDEEEHNWDHAAFFVDGVEISRQDGQTDWLDVTHTIATEGSHTVEWVYVKDEAEADGEDCMWVKDIVWMPERTQTSEVKVETTWLKAYFPALGSYYFDYEEMAKETAANGHKVWECYVAGEDPTDSASKFAAEITVGEDGKPSISWNPDLGEARVYKILGSTDLKTWVEIPEGEEANYNFFKVSVEMP